MREALRCATPYLDLSESEILHGRLRMALRKGSVVLRINEVRLNAPGSPAHSNLDNITLVVIVLGGLITTFWHFGLWLGIASLMPWLIGYRMGAGVILGRVNRRATKMAKASDAHFDELWRWGALKLETADGSAVATSNDDWRIFIRDHCAKDAMA